MFKKISSSLSIKVFLYIGSLLLATSLIIYGVIMVVMPKSYKSELSGQFSKNLGELLTQLEKSKYEEASGYIYNFCVVNHASVTLESKTIKENYGAFREYGLTDSKDSKMMISAFTTFQFKDSNEMYSLRVSVSEQPVNQITALLLKMLPWIVALILIISFIGAWFCSRFLTKPIIKISSISKKMSTLEMTWRCDIQRPDEIGVLASSLNSMAHNLETALTELKTANEKLQMDIDRERRQEKQRRDFFAAVSHELKTPITIIKGQLEGMIHNVGIYKDRDQYLRQSLKTAESMEHLVKEILTTVKLEAEGFQLKLMEVDLSGIIIDCCQQIAGLALDKNIQISTELEGEMVILGDKRLLHRAISNIINNAVFHSPVGAGVWVDLFLRNGRGILTVENGNISFEDEDIERIFTPFYRVEQSHNRNSGGSGLGLYITKTIFDLHKIGYRIENSDRGVKFSAEFSVI